MQLAIIHYHFNRGGVSQAVLNHLHALATLPAGERPTKAVLFYSGQRDGWPESVWQGTAGDEPFPVELKVVPSLEYDSTIAASEPDLLADRLRDALTDAGCDVESTIVHSHNHSLGKNASLPGALRRLADSGYRLLLQVHDFAEDFRPANYRHLCRATRSETPEKLAEELYPVGPGVHYAVLNGRDDALLSRAGVPADRLHTLPNPVLPFHGRPPREEARGRVHGTLGLTEETRLVIYPVRGIRRKNVGEMLLHATLAGEGSHYAITLAPTNPVEVPPFSRWCDLAGELGLPCSFDIGGAATGGKGRVAFSDALAAADALITTSVAEGFGMVFLEAWLAGGVLVGRDLPEITADFRTTGIRFDQLATELLVPSGWLDTDLLEAELHELHRWTCQDYGLAEPVRGDTLVAKGPTIDFASLPADHQREVIRRVATDPTGARDELCELNPGLATQLCVSSKDHLASIDENADRVREAYSPAAIGRRLAAAYAAALNEPRGAAPTAISNGRSILDYFLTLQRLRPVRLET